MKKILIYSNVLLFLFVSIAYSRSCNICGIDIEGQHTDTVAIIDAGSSGSRIMLYEVSFRDTTFGINKIDMASINPGISSMDTSMQKGLDSISKLLSKFDSVYTKKIPLYIMATAGMRLLSDEKQQMIYDTLTNYINEFHKRFDLKYCNTIKGKYEGLYDWLAAKYGKSEVLSSDFGILEVGGASVQYTFKISGSKFDEDNMLIREDQDGAIDTIYSKSYLGSGVNEMRRHFSEDFYNRKSSSIDSAFISSIFDSLKNNTNFVSPWSDSTINKLSAYYPSTFYGLSAMYYTIRDLDSRSIQKSLLDVAISKYDRDNSNIDSSFSSAYIFELLKQSFADLNPSPEIQIYDKDEYKQPSWTFGAIYDIVNGNNPE